MKNIDICVSSEFKLPQKACNKCTLGVMDGNNPHLWNKCFCECHKMNGFSECEGYSEAFQLGYENWCEPCNNPYIIGSKDYHLFNLPLSPYICPVCDNPFWIIRECNSSYDLNLGKIIPHSPVQTIPRKS